MCLRSKQSSLFSFYALPSGGKSKDEVVLGQLYFNQVNLTFFTLKTLKLNCTVGHQHIGT